MMGILGTLPGRTDGPHTWLWDCIYAEAERHADFGDKMLAKLPEDSPLLVDKPARPREERVRVIADQIFRYLERGICRMSPDGTFRWWNPSRPAGDAKLFEPFNEDVYLAWHAFKESMRGIGRGLSENYTGRQEVPEASADAFTGVGKFWEEH
jgi:hypothetical protein